MGSASRARAAAMAAMDWAASQAAATLRAERDRLVLWVPVAFGAGVAMYFGLAAEPAVWAAPSVAAFGGVAALLLLRRAGNRWRLAGAAAVALCLIALGAAAAQLRSWQVAAPVLVKRWGTAELAGRVVASELRPEGRRLILDQLTMSGMAPANVPARVRLRVGRDQQVLPLPGARVVLRAQLHPPPIPTAPGAYDFARWAWFERIGAVGSARGAIRVVTAGEAAGWRLALDAARARLVAWVLVQDPGPAGQISAALLTGEMGHIEPGLMAAMRDSGLAHLLSISGLHITLVAGIVFFAIRRGLALMPPLALRCNGKKLAAGGAILAITAYASFAAPGVPVLRAWIMGAIVLVAILLDRSPLSMRLVAWAALAILALVPEAILGPSFQMSFAAVVALIACWEAAAPVFRRWRDGAGPVGRLLVVAAGALMTTAAASVATAPFALYHFNRLSFFAIAANLVAVPLTSVLVMPAAVLVFLCLPFGVADLPLAAMNLGNEAVATIAQTVAAWPGAARPAPAMPVSGFVAAILGGLWLALWRCGWRWLGAVAVVAGLASPWLAARPDIRISGDGRLVGLRLADGGLALRGSGNIQMARDTWLRRAGVETAAPWPAAPAAGPGVVCRPDICWIEAPGHLAALVTGPRGFAAACSHATFLATTYELWRDCPAPLRIVDRQAISRSGGVEIFLAPDGSVGIRSVAGLRGERPWTRTAGDQ